MAYLNEKSFHGLGPSVDDKNPVSDINATEFPDGAIDDKPDGPWRGYEAQFTSLFSLINQNSCQFHVSIFQFLVITPYLLCKCHDSVPIMAYANFRSNNLCRILRTTLNRNQIGLVIAQSLVDSDLGMNSIPCALRYTSTPWDALSQSADYDWRLVENPC